MEVVEEIRDPMPRTGVQGAHPAKSFALSRPIILRWSVASRKVRVLPAPFVRWSKPFGQLVFVGSVHFCNRVHRGPRSWKPRRRRSPAPWPFVRFPLASAPMILEALPAGVSVCGRVRPPSLPFLRLQQFGPIATLKLLEALHRALLFVSGTSEGLLVVLGGGGARKTPPGSARCSVSVGTARNGPWKDFWDVPLRRH